MRPDTCDSDRLDAFLKGTLADRDEQELTEHLSHCVACASELEQRAADRSQWDDAQRLLSEPFSAEIPLAGAVDHADEMPLSVRQVIDMMNPTDDPGSLGRVGGYEVLGVVGSGAMGVVLKAADRTLDRVVALKVMNPSLAACGTARQRFAREAKAAAGVLHPNVIAIHSVSADDALPYLVMPYVKGASLQQRLDRHGPLELTEILRIGSQVAAGLAAAHQQGLIHRDIKPSNIMLDEGVETAVITDFGLARTIDDATMTRSGAITGTPEFMSPEQARGEPLDFSSDVFSLGSVLYAIATGRRPFRAETPFGVLRKITEETPPPIRELNPDIPQWFCGLVDKLHAKSPDERPSTAEVHDLLEGCLGHVYQPDRIPLPDALSKPDAVRSILSRPLQLGALALMTVTILALLFMFGFPSDAPSTEVPVAPLTGQQGTSDEPEIYKTLELSFPDPDRRGKLIVDINRGYIDVVGHDHPEVIIEVLNPLGHRASSAADSEIRPQFAPKYDLDKDTANNSIKLDTYNYSYALNLRVKVPHETDLSLDNYYDGYLQVKNVSGTLDARSQHSDIRLLDISGSASAYSRNGCLTIRFREVAPDARLDFESYNGSIDLTLPSSTAATTAVSTGTGTYFSAFDIQRQTDDVPSTWFPDIKPRNVENYQFGTINGGGVPLRIEGEKGDIVLRKPDKGL